MQMGKEKPRKVCGRIGAALGLRIRMAHCMAKKYDVHREVCYLALMLLGPFGEQLQWGCHYMLSLKTRTCWSHASLLGLQWYPFLTQLYDHFSVHPYICLVEKTNEFFSSSTKVESYSILAGKGKWWAPVVQDWRFLCLSWLPCDCTVHEHWSNGHPRVYAGAWAGKSRYRGDPSASPGHFAQESKENRPILWRGLLL